jgi:hypothetical protein
MGRDPIQAKADRIEAWGYEAPGYSMIRIEITGLNGLSVRTKRTAAVTSFESSKLSAV